jgi:glycosyltransferase involved in cell wall biosynthesis
MDPSIRQYDLGINYEDNNGKSFLNKMIRYPFKQWKHKRALEKLLSALDADVVISMFCNDASILPKIKDGSKKVLEIHFSRFKRLQYGRAGLWKLADQLRSKNDLKVVSRFDKFVVLTEEDKGYWGDLDNIQVIPNARSFVVEEPAMLDEKRVIAVGRYCYQKDLGKLINAWKIVCETVSEWKLHLVGDGEDREMLQQQIDRLGLSDRVVLGRAETDMKAVYKSASMLALSSRYEGLPMVLLEAQAAGLPIVSFKCKCGPKDVIEDGVDGILVEEGDVDGLAAGMLKLIQNEGLRKSMGAAAYLRSERYAEEEVMYKWNTLFYRVIQ